MHKVPGSAQTEAAAVWRLLGAFPTSAAKATIILELLVYFSFPPARPKEQGFVLSPESATIPRLE